MPSMFDFIGNINIGPLTIDQWVKAGLDPQLYVSKGDASRASPYYNVSSTVFGAQPAPETPQATTNPFQTIADVYFDPNMPKAQKKTIINSAIQNTPGLSIEGLAEAIGADVSVVRNWLNQDVPQFGDPKSTGQDPFGGYTETPTEKPQEAAEDTLGGGGAGAGGLSPDGDLAGSGDVFGDTTLDSPERPWVFNGEQMENVLTGEVVDVSDPSLYTKGEYYSQGDVGMSPEEPAEAGALSDETRQGIRWWIINHPNATLEDIQTAMENNDISEEDFIEATGNTPEGVADINATRTGTGDGTGVGTGTGPGTGTGTGDGTGTGIGRGVSSETLQGMLFAAASPTRTTDEVLKPDLFKLDVNIPLVQRLTQYSPMAAPQYLLSGISQRYKV